MTATTRTPRRRLPTFDLDHITYVNLCDLARRSGYSVRTLQRWKTTGIPLHSADQLACRLGHHPATIWPHWFHADTHPDPKRPIHAPVHPHDR